MATSNMQQNQAMQLIAPDIAQEQTQLMRRQQLADMLRKQSLESSGPTEMVGGWAVKKSPYEGLAKLAQALAANYVQDKTDTRQLELAKEAEGRMGSMFGEGTTSPSIASSAAQTMGASQQPSTPDATGAMVNQGGVGPTNENAARMGNILAQGAGTAPQGGGLTIPGMTSKQAKLAFMLDQNAYMGSYLKQFDPTERQRNDRYMGITSPESRAAYDAENRVKGTQTLAPNTTGILPNGSKVVGADFANGTQPGYDASGNATLSAIPGADIIAGDRARVLERAKLGAADPFKPLVTVQLPSGPQLMTEEQARKLTNGGKDPAYPQAAPAPAAPAPSMFRPPNAAPPSPRGKSMFSSTEIEKDQAYALNRELTKAETELTNAKTPEETIRLKDTIDGLGREMARSHFKRDTTLPVSNESVGIKLQDESSKKFGEQVASKSADALLESRDKAKAASDSLIGIEKSRAAIVGGVFQGSGAETKLAIAKFFNGNVPGINIDPEKVSNTDYLKSTLGAGLLAEAKTLGANPSNADAKRIEDIVGSLSKDPGAMKMILDWRQQMAERSIKGHNATVDDAEKRGMTSPYGLRVTAPQAAPATPPAAQAAPASKNFATLPNPAEFNGKRMRAPDGSVIRSNGKTWVKE